jgi:hypothetical protein
MPLEWLTYAQAGEKYGLSPEAVRLRARRFGWRTQPGNDGRTLVMVPEDAAVRPRPRPPVRSPEQPPDHVDEIARLTARTERAESDRRAAEQRANEANRRADAADSDRREAVALVQKSVAMLTDERGRADRAEAAITGERQRADALRDRLVGTQAELTLAQAAAERARVDVQEAQRRAEALEQAEDARQARGRWARLRAAWHGR